MYISTRLRLGKHPQAARSQYIMGTRTSTGHGYAQMFAPKLATPQPLLYMPLVFLALLPCIPCPGLWFLFDFLLIFILLFLLFPLRLPAEGVAPEVGLRTGWIWIGLLVSLLAIIYNHVFRKQRMLLVYYCHISRFRFVGDTYTTQE